MHAPGLIPTGNNNTYNRQNSSKFDKTFLHNLRPFDRGYAEKIYMKLVAGVRVCAMEEEPNLHTFEYQHILLLSDIWWSKF